MRVRVEVAVPPAESATRLTLNAVVGPGGDTDSERLTVPAKLLMLDRVIVDMLDDPWRMVRVVGKDAIVKPWTAKSPFIVKGWREQ